jgi:hypothetical protein
MNIPIFYFGQIGEAGHYTWNPITRRPVSWEEEKSLTPWKYDIDGLVVDKVGYKEGVLYHEQKDGWTLIGFPEYSIDTRPNSHSTFVTNQLLTASEMLDAAKIAWPQVFSRFKFTIKLPTI